MTSIRVAPVVVGVNGSAASLAAVRTASREAAMRDRPLRVVHAFSWPLYDTGPQGRPYGLLRQDAAAVLDRALRAATADEPSVPVTGEVVDGWPTTVLLRESRSAALLVLGDDGIPESVCPPADSILVQLVARARCPVLVTVGRARSRGTVLVGLDGSAMSQLAVDLAFDEAARRHAPLTAVHAWEPDLGAAAERTADELLAATVHSYSAKYSEVEVRTRAAPGDPVEVLVRESATAQLLVIGCRGAGGRPRTLLGTAGQALLRRCGCPTIFVHAAVAGPVS